MLHYESEEMDAAFSHILGRLAIVLLNCYRFFSLSEC